MISKVINGKRKSNKVIKLLDNMDTFAQSDYEYNSLHIIIKKLVVFLKGYLNSQHFTEASLKYQLQDTSSLIITDERKPQVARLFLSTIFLTNLNINKINKKIVDSIINALSPT
jgi:hypothetical protein